MLITLWFGLVVWWWFAYYFTVSDVLVVWLWFIGWRMKWLWWRGGVGWIVRRGSGLTWVVVVYLMWIMEFGLTVWLWLCRRAAGRGSWYYWCSSVVRLSWFSTLIEVCDGWLIRCFETLLWWGVWLVEWWMMNDEWWFVVSVIDDSLFRLRFTCYLLLGAHVLWLFVWLRLTVGWSGV